MIGYQPFLIANPRVGMERDMEPWIIPEDAYPDLQDCYLWRGRVKKKSGYEFLGRLNLQIPVASIVYGANKCLVYDFFLRCSFNCRDCLF